MEKVLIEFTDCKMIGSKEFHVGKLNYIPY